jgi:FADH2 O2-dependent halogenase
LSLLYFAAASYSENARRLGRPWLADSFLLHDHPVFGVASRDLCARARLPRSGEESRNLVADILAALEPFNVAGLGDPLRKNWYPADAEDLFRSAHKVGASRGEIAELLERCGYRREIA